MDICAFCGKPATNWCDYVLGFTVQSWHSCTRAAAFKAGRIHQYAPGKGLPCVGHGSDMFTCDAPLCDSCGSQKGMMFVDGNKANTYATSIDHCPFHAYEYGDLSFTDKKGAERQRWLIWGHRLKMFATSKSPARQNTPSRPKPHSS